MLASASPARLRLLTTAGFDPEVIVSGVDEDGVDVTDPTSAVLSLAIAKAVAVASRDESSGALVLGCDSMLDVDGIAHGKPATVDVARARLRLLEGRTAVLRTGHCVIDTSTGALAADHAATTVRFGTFAGAELEAYLATGEPLAVAGAFTLDGYCAPFIDGIDGDHGNVIGLSLPLLRELLARVGVSVCALWR